ncbi:lamin tail domain-containing protein [Candidatus Woesearchaeota archaeon]|nr:lamin tail domain-containing protein [Candidatus Woesearchaeota archaeon]
MKSKTLNLIIAALFLLVLLSIAASAAPNAQLSASATTVETTVILTASATDVTSTLNKLILYRDGVEIQSYDCRHRHSCMYIRTEIETNATTHIYQAKAVSDDGKEDLSNTVQVTFTGFVYEYPQWSNPDADPDSPVVYDPNRVYTFTVDWELSDWYPDKEYVFFESNYSGTWQDYSTTRDYHTYTYTVTGINAGTFIWRMHATDEQGNSNITDDYPYTILKADATIELTLNTTVFNYAVERLSTLIAEASVLVGETTTMNLYKNDTFISTIEENDPIPIVFDETGYFEIILEYPGTNNYKPVNVSLFVDVTDTIAPGPVSDINATNITDYSITWEFTPPPDDDLNHTIITLYDITDTIISTQTVDSTTTTVTFTGLDYNTGYYSSYQTFDEDGNTDPANIVNSTVVTTLDDTFAPLWFDVFAFPESPVTYDPNQTYQFNSTWTDARLNTVVIEHNFTGTLQNYTITTNNSNEYYYDYPTIAAGTYTWRIFADDTAGNVNSTPYYPYIVNPVASACSLTITPGSPTTYGTPINASCSCTNLEAAETLYRDGIDVTAENNQNVTLGAGTYDYVCNVSATQNYTAASASETYTINKATSWVTLLLNNLASDITVTYPNTVNASFTSNVPTAIMYRDGGDVTGENNIAQLLPAGIYNYTVEVVADANTTASSITRFATVKKAASTCTLTFTPSSGWDDLTPLNASCSCTNPEASETLYRNGTDVTGAENNQYVTLAAGDHGYVCNVTETANYLSATDSEVISVAFAPRPSGNVVINEYMAQPSSGNDWVELYNNDSVTIDLTGWTLNDSVSTMATLSGLLNPGAFLYIEVSNRLNNGGDDIILSNSTGGLIDTYTYAASIVDVSVGRYPDGTANWYDQEYPTPNASNVGPDSVAPVINSISDSPDPVDQGQNITITANVTDNIGVGNVWVDIGGTNYTMNLVAGLYEYAYNTTALAPGLNSYTVYADDMYGTEAIPQTGSFTVNDVIGPTINSVAGSPDPVERGTDITITANVTDDVAVNSVLLEIAGTNYTMTYSTGDLWTYNYSTGTSPVGVNNYNVYADDNSGNPATPVAGAFTVQDTTGPSITGTSPTNGASLSAGTTSTTITVTTNEIAICRYNTTDQAWANMTEMPTTNATTHQLPVSGLSNGNTYHYYFLCEDSIPNQMASSYHLQFSVSTGGGGGGGGSSGGGSSRKTYYINITKEGVGVGLTRRDRAVFDFNAKQYVAEAVSVASTSSTLTLDSKSYIFNTGDELTFDLDKDGEEDISIELSEIRLGRATYIFKLAQEEEPFLQPAKAPTTIKTEEAAKSRLPGLFREEVEETSEGIGGATMFFKKIIKSPYMKYIGMGLIILVLAIAVISGITNKDKIILFFKKKKKNNNKKPKKKK